MSDKAEVHFVGAGPGAPDLITVRGMKLIEQADAAIKAAKQERKQEGLVVERNQDSRTVLRALKIEN